MRGRHLTQNDLEGGIISLDNETRLGYSMRVARLQLAGAGILAKNPRLAMREARAAGKYDISNAIKKVFKAGVPVHVITSHSDEMFDRHKIETGYEIIADHLTSYSSLTDSTASHDTFWLHPERSAFLISRIMRSDN